ncbi:MAG: ATP-binding cassette domain-containing protein [Alphaproteobacteria bacterium]|nr:ATP-binding cassette domain-containing protein [Alphaproteobacteria bacterium]
MPHPESSPSPAPPVVEFEHVGLRYGVGPEVLRDLKLTLPPSSFHFLTGPSGAGKSSLLSLLYLSRMPSRGRLSIFGEDVAKADRRTLTLLRRRIGVVFQDFRLFDHLSVVDNASLPLRIAGRDPQESRTNVVELLDWVGLGGLLDARPPTLSGGQKQRLAIARAVVARPKLLLADEPTGNVDDQLAVRLLYLFEALHRMGTTVVIATHNMSLVERFAYPELRLDDGQITRLPAKAARLL